MRAVKVIAVHALFKMAAKSEQSTAITVIDGIGDKIYVVRGQRVMLDRDLADIYRVETKVLKQAVRRNRDKFPKDFFLELTLKETRAVESLRSQIVTLDESRRGKYSKYKAFAFTEHGAVMLASVLNSPTAVEASIAVVRAFVKMRSILALHKDLAKKIDQLAEVAARHDGHFDVVFQLLGEIMRDPKYLRRKIGFVEAKKKK